MNTVVARKLNAGRVLAIAAALCPVVACRSPNGTQERSLASPSATLEQKIQVNTGVTHTDAVSPLGPPEKDLPTDRLHEHVDGAAPFLQSIGCRRLLFWRVAQPAAELEVLVFTTDAGAKQALDKDAASERSQAVPGDEGWTNSQVVYFRRGTHYCRLIADSPVPNDGLREYAQKIDRAIVAHALFH